MIHKTAIIDSKAKISSTVEIGPYTIIGPNVVIEEGVLIQSHVNITGHTIIGKNNRIYSMASIGSDPQDLKYQGPTPSNKWPPRSYTYDDPERIYGKNPK